MLSRTASSLYWMARYLERAENISRLLDVSYNMSLMPHSESGMQELLAPLTITGQHDRFFEKHDSINSKTLLEFFLFDSDNEGSIYNCLRSARDNAHSVRDKMSADAWESINATWLEYANMSTNGVQAYGAKALFDWIKQRSHEFRGAGYGTMLRNDAFHFLRLGTFLERTDNTARILDVKYQVMQHNSERNRAVDFYQWNSLLQSLSAYEAYHECYKHGLSKRNVAELLILSAEMPRSLRFSVGIMSGLLEKIEGDRGLTAKRLTASLFAKLNFGEIDYIIDYGLHAYLNNVLADIKEIGEQIHRSYWGS